jgi:hypothetical protein
VSSVIIAIVTEPIDEFVLSFLNLDEQGSLLKDVVSKGNSPVRTVQTSLATTLVGDAPAMILQHFGSAPNLRQKHLHSIRSMVVQLSGEIFFRLGVYFDRYPFKLLRLVCGGYSDVEKSAFQPDTNSSCRQ